jgi:signal transduction histidine kinase
MVICRAAPYRCHNSGDENETAVSTAVSMTADAASVQATGRQRGRRAAETWLATIHLLTDLPMGVLTFVPMTVGLSLSLGLLPLFLLGIPILLITMTIAGVLARIERARYAITLGERIPDPRPPRQPRVPGETWLNRLHRRIAAPHAWRAISYLMLLLPLSAITFTLAITLWSGPLALLTLPIYNWALPNGGADFGFVTVRNVPATIGVGLLGLLLLLAAPYAVRGLAAMDAAIARTLLGPFSTKELAERVGHLEESRARLVDSADAERRRIERDLHDGAQQRLVALAMNLGRARSRYDDDPAAARALLDEAHSEAKQALVELRNLARGIHPAVLTDRGLDAALSGLAGRSPIPVTVEVDVGTRPSRTIEAIAYFVVAEALTNVAKHSRANRAWVVVRRLDGELRIIITDNGVGGADPTGGGLAGLADRVSGVDGRLLVHSPAGGPTLITVELPCAS